MFVLSWLLFFLFFFFFFQAEDGIRDVAVTGVQTCALPICELEVSVPDGEVKEAELKLAKQLIDQTSNEVFEPAKYRDTVRERVLETIQRKIEGQDITGDVAPGADTKMIDLMEALKASLAREKPKKAEGSKKRMAS